VSVIRAQSYTSRVFRAFVLALLLGGAAASAAELLPVEDAKAIRAVIADQLDAFARDDAKHAFSLATTGIRERFGTPEVFMDMVRSGYPVVYRPKSVQFEEPALLGGEVIQPVRMTDADGGAWIALYPMERQPDGAWRINGCRLVKLQAQRV